jgi:hypothetical protein
VCSARKVKAKSLLGVTMLAADEGNRVVLETDSRDETEAFDAIVALFGDLFGKRSDAKRPSSNRRRGPCQYELRHLPSRALRTMR